MSSYAWFRSHMQQNKNHRNQRYNYPWKLLPPLFATHCCKLQGSTSIRVLLVTTDISFHLFTYTCLVDSSVLEKGSLFRYKIAIFFNPSQIWRSYNMQNGSYFDGYGKQRYVGMCVICVILLNAKTVLANSIAASLIPNSVFGFLLCFSRTNCLVSISGTGTLSIVFRLERYFNFWDIQGFGCLSTAVSRNSEQFILAITRSTANIGILIEKEIMNNKVGFT